MLGTLSLPGAKRLIENGLLGRGGEGGERDGGVSDVCRPTRGPCASAWTEEMRLKFEILAQILRRAAGGSDAWLDGGWDIQQHREKIELSRDSFRTNGSFSFGAGQRGWERGDLAIDSLIIVGLPKKPPKATNATRPAYLPYMRGRARAVGEYMWKPCS
jgi:hypothetical protein